MTRSLLSAADEVVSLADLARLPVTEHKRGFAINADLYEAERTKSLGSCGIRILRFDDKVPLNNLEAVLDAIQAAITETSVA